jgi:hypothetical protein
MSKEMNRLLARYDRPSSEGGGGGAAAAPKQDNPFVNADQMEWEKKQLMMATTTDQ